MKSFKEWRKINEIGDRITTPVISKINRLSENFFLYDIVIDSVTYIVCIQLFTNDHKTAIKIDFGKSVNGNLSNEMTNFNIVLKIMSNLAGVFREWLKDYTGNEKIVSIIVAGKSEFLSDERRSNIYDFFVKKNLEKLGTHVIEVVDITEAWFEESHEEVSGKILKYRIDPITLDEMRNFIKSSKS